VHIAFKFLRKGSIFDFDLQVLQLCGIVGQQQHSACQ